MYNSKFILSLHSNSNKKKTMGGLSTKATRLKVRTITRNSKLKQITFQPVIRKIDVQAIKEEFAAKSSESKAKPTKKEVEAIENVEKKEVKKAKVAEPKAEAKESKKEEAKKVEDKPSK
jgi:hypothetical protein